MSNRQNNSQSPLQFVTIEPASTSHIAIKKQALCEACENKPCTYYCPTRVYWWESELLYDYTRCIECGACPFGCPQGNIAWEYPPGGYGVIYQI